MTPDTPEAEAQVNESNNSRDAVAEAFDKHATEAAPETAAVAAPSEDAQATTSGRDAAGRFTPKRTDTPAKIDPTGTPVEARAAAPDTVDAVPKAADTAPAPDAAAPLKHAKAPASWKPEESAHWEKAPPEVRDAVMRREVEMNRAMQESANARQGLAQLQQSIAPYIPNIQAANGGDVVGAIQTFFDYDNRLRHGTQIEKARAVTALIKGYGIDIGTLDNELAGAQHSPEQVNQSAIQQALAREMAPVREYMARAQADERARYAQSAETVDRGIEAFAAKPEHKHYEAVRNDMADLIELATSRGQQITLEQAYERATWQHPEIRRMLIAEQASASGQTQTQAAQRARSAAVGVRNAPRAGAPAATLPAAGRDNRMADIAAAFASHSGQE